jgi:hypothetical protein
MKLGGGPLSWSLFLFPMNSVLMMMLKVTTLYKCSPSYFILKCQLCIMIDSVEDFQLEISNAWGLGTE